MTKKTKKKSKRDKQEFPDLDPKYTIKRRRDYIDNRYYVNGVKHNGEKVMRELTKEEKKFLNQFNKEYYGDDFRGNPDKILHKQIVDDDTIKDIYDQIRVLKKERKKIYDKSPNTTTQEHRDLANYYTEQIEDMYSFLEKVKPRKICSDGNNTRNADLLNYAKASNVFRVTSWETLTDEIITEIDPSLHITPVHDKDSEES